MRRRSNYLLRSVPGAWAGFEVGGPHLGLSCLMYPCSFPKTGPDRALSPHPPALKSVVPDASPQVPHLPSKKAVMALGHTPTHTLLALQAGGTDNAGLGCKQRGAVLACKFSSDPIRPTQGCFDGEELQRARSLQRWSCLPCLLMGYQAAPYCIWDPHPPHPVPAVWHSHNAAVALLLSSWSCG